MKTVLKVTNAVKQLRSDNFLLTADNLWEKWLKVYGPNISKTTFTTMLTRDEK
jgi:hypothetical protein